MTQTTEKNQTTLILVVLMIGTFVAMLNQTLLTAALPKIMVDLQIDANKGQWLTTAFMLVNGIMIPITAYLINVLRTRVLFISAMGIFTIGTLIAAFSDSFNLLMIGRIFQALGAGIMMPLTQTVLLFLFPPEKRGAVMGMMGIVIAFAPAVGPTISGWLVDSYNWNSLFYVIAPIAIIDIIMAVFLLKNVGKTTPTKLDALSVATSTLGFGGLLYGFSSQGTYGWANGHVYWPLLIGSISLIIFTWRQLTLEQPLLDLRVLKSRPFTISILITVLLFASMIAGGMIIPLYVQSALGYSAFHSGLLLLPGAALMGIMSPINGRIFDKYGPRKLSTIGMVILTAGSVPFMFLTDDISLTYLVLVYSLRMLGISMVMMPLTTWGMNSLSNAKLAHGSAVNNTLRQVAGSIGTAILFTVMSNGTKSSDAATPVLKLIHGMNLAFGVAAVLSLIGLIGTFIFVKEQNGLTTMKSEKTTKATV